LSGLKPFQRSRWIGFSPLGRNPEDFYPPGLFFDNLDSGSSGICKHNAIWVIGLRIGGPADSEE
jgi:hypothetical protein